MIYSFAGKIALFLFNKQALPSDEVDIVTYGLFSAISKIMYGIISLALGSITGCFIESVCFYISLLFIRKYAGGFHAKTEFKCFLLSSCSIAVSIMWIFFTKRIPMLACVTLGLSIIAYFLIAVYSPVPALEKMLDENECKRYSIISRIRVGILILICLLSYFFKLEYIYISVSIAVILESIILIAGKLKVKKVVSKSL